MNEDVNTDLDSSKDAESVTPQKGLNPMIIGVGALVIVVIGVVFMMMNKSTSSDVDNLSSGQNATMAPELTTNPEVEGVSQTATTEGDLAATTINMEAGSFYFKPNQIKVKKGEKVKIILSSKDMMHDFNIDELGVKIPITKSGATNSVEFTPTKAGTFEFYCSVGQHRKNGQVGKIVVE